MVRSHVCRERFSWERGPRSDLLRDRGHRRDESGGHVSSGAPLLCGRLWCRARVLPCDARRRRGGDRAWCWRSWSGGRQVARCDTIRYTPGDRSLRTQRSGVAAAGLMLGERAWPRRAGCWELGGLPGLVACAGRPSSAALTGRRCGEARSQIDCLRAVCCRHCRWIAKCETCTSPPFAQQLPAAALCAPAICTQRQGQRYTASTAEAAGVAPISVQSLFFVLQPVTRATVYVHAHVL